LEETLNYENLFLLVRKAMELPSMLIETVAMEVAADLLETFPTINRVWVSIEKSNPPIEKMEGSVKVVYEAFRG
jgi:dihydroneopterin aldolase